MSNCQNCYNGCVETTSDQCVKYTGVDIPELGIVKGDPLSLVLLQMNNAIIALETGIPTTTTTTTASCSIAPEYIGYDLLNNCQYPGTFSVDFMFIPSEVLVGMPLSPCIPGVGPSGGGGVSNCPIGTIEYRINAGPKVTTTSTIWANEAVPYILACEQTVVHLNSEVNLLAYAGQTVTMNYKVTYPTTPPISFTESITALIPVCI